MKKFQELFMQTTIEDSNQYICKEVICDVNELAKCAKSNIEIVNEFKREEGLEVLKNYGTSSKN